MSAAGLDQRAVHLEGAGSEVSGAPTPSAKNDESSAASCRGKAASQLVDVEI
jgi:hypothetical protein